MEFKKENYFTKHEDNVIKTMSLDELKNAVDYLVNTANMRNKCPCEIPVYFTYNDKKYELSKRTTLGLFCCREIEVHIDFTDYYSIEFVAPYSRP